MYDAGRPIGMMRDWMFDHLYFENGILFLGYVDNIYKVIGARY
jgi:hypothetical protein